ncbi:MAG: hypothetical protein HW376_80, partial [candidate division NC10 bacterium]|nr:hypothetical protein [candidate division NC10 bacterium]
MPTAAAKLAVQTRLMKFGTALAP